MDKANNRSITFVTSPFFIEGMYIEPLKNIVTVDGESCDVQPKVMDVLCFLCTRAEQLVTTNELIECCWPNQYIGDSPVHKCIAQIRKLLSDNSKAPRFIKTVPKKGYIFIGHVRGLTQGKEVTKTWFDGCPYPGGKAYSAEQKDIFFGREQVIVDIGEWLSKLGGNDTAWLSIVAPVRSGKTSLVNAGVLPYLASSNFFTDTNVVVNSLIFDMRDVKETHQYFHIALIEWLQSHNLINSQMSSELCMAQVKGAGDELFSMSALEAKSGTKFVIFIDHLEELYRDFSSNIDAADDIADFTQILALIANTKQLLLITAIEERFHEHFKESNAAYKDAFVYELLHFSSTELFSIIQKPAELTGVAYEYNAATRERLDSVIIKELQLNTIPIHFLQRFLQQLYLSKEKTQITYKAYESFDGLFGNLAMQVDHFFQSLSYEEQSKFEQLLFSLLAISNDGDIETQIKRCDLAGIEDETEKTVIQKCIESGLLQQSNTQAATYIYLVHDSLISNWHVIVEWLKAHISILYIRHDLQIFVGRWLYHQKSDQYLIPSDKKLQQIKAVLDSDAFDATEDEKSLFLASKTKLKKASRLRNLVGTMLFVSVVGLASLTLILTGKNEQLKATRSSAETLISFILYDLKERLEPLGKLELLDLVAVKTLDYYQLESTDHASGESLHHWATALHILGQVDISKHNYQQAEAYFLQTARALKIDLQSEQSEQSLELHMLANYWLGYIAYVEFDYAKAEPYFNSYLASTTKLYELFPDDKWLLEKSYALNNLGSIAESQNQIQLAASYFEQSYQLKLQLLEKQPNDNSLRQDIADTRSWQSNIEAKAGKLYTAIGFMDEALTQVTRIYELEQDKAALEYMSDFNHRIALYYFDAGDIENSLKHIDLTQNNLQLLIQNDSENVIYLNDLLWSFHLQIKVYINQSQFDLALVKIEAAKRIISDIQNNEAYTLNTIKNHIYLMLDQTHIMDSLGHNQSAQNSLQRALTTFTQHLESHEDIALATYLAITKTLIYFDNLSLISSQDRTELNEIKVSLATKLTKSPSDFKTIYLYLTILKLLGNFDDEGDWNKRYKESDYKIKDYLAIKVNERKNI